jgi:hypothetical protein
VRLGNSVYFLAGSAETLARTRAYRALYDAADPACIIPARGAGFGALCCQRLAAYRQALFLLMLVAGANLSRPARPAMIGAPVLALAALIHLQPRLLAIGQEYRLAGARAVARSVIFTTGMAPGPAPLDYAVAPRGPLFNYRDFSPGTYTYQPNAPGPSQFPMMYFGKPMMCAHDYGRDAR